MPGWDNDVAFCSGIDTRGVTPVVNQMDADGKLLIASTVAPYIRANTLSSAGGTVTITNGAGSINLEAGGGVPTMFTAEDASTCTPVANNLNIVGTSTNGIDTTAFGDTLTIGMSTALYGDFSFTNLAPATSRTLGVINTDNNASSTSELRLSVPTAGADPMVTYEIQGTAFYSAGVDNSDSDKFKLTNSSSPSAGDAIISTTQAGVIALFNDLDVTEGGTGVSTLTSHGVLMGNGASDIQATAEPSNGQLLIGKTGDFPVLATLTDGAGTLITEGAGTITIANIFSSTAENKVGTESSKSVSPATLYGYMADLGMTGFVSWTGAGAYFDDTTLGTFSLLRGGTGYIKGKLITFAGAQSVTGLTAGNLYWIYIDSAGILQKASAFSDTIFTDNIPLFECLRDSTAPTNTQVTVKENHPYNFQTSVSLYNHNVIGCVIENITNGANITLNGTQKIQINGADVLSDHGIDTTIPDSGGVGVTWYKYFTLASGKWALYNTTDTFSGHYNNAGVVAALSAGRLGVYTLYCSKDNLNTTTPFYFAVLHTEQFTSLSSANTAISNGTIAKASNELANLEISQLGYIIFSQSANAIVQVTISKATLKQTLSTGGTNTAALVNTNTSAFDGWLSTADTNVQAALDELDDSQRLTEVTDAAATLAINRGVIANRGTLVTLTLPTVAKVGDEFEVVGKGAGLWKIEQNANQSIHWIASTTTVGVGGSLAATNIYDSIKFYCTVASLEFTVISAIGNITLV